MSDLDDCTIEELDELIRVVVLTNPWSTVQKFPDLKKIHVIRSEGFANAKGDPIKKVAPKGDLTEDELFELKQTEMREKGMRLISGK